MLAHGARIALVANSDGRWPSSRPDFDALVEYFEEIGLAVSISPAIFAPERPPVGELRPHNWVEAAPDAARARILEGYFRDPEVAAIFDVSGGSIANGVLSYLDFDVVRANAKPFIGYSDLSTLVNAMAVETGREQYWWQVRHLASEGRGDLRERFAATFLVPPPPLAFPSQLASSLAERVGSPEEPVRQPDAEGVGSPEGLLFDLKVRFVQGESMAGRLVGGNLTCFLKLAGTRWFPDVTGAIVAIESLGLESGDVYTGFHQLRQLGVFSNAAGVLLGQFTRLTELAGEDAAERIALDVVGNADLAIAVTQDFGHSHDSRALAIGRHYAF